MPIPWITALRIFNEGKPAWCIPRKGTAPYKTVHQIQVEGRKRTVSELMDEFEPKRGSRKTRKPRRRQVLSLAEDK